MRKILRLMLTVIALVVAQSHSATAQTDATSGLSIDPAESQKMSAVLEQIHGRAWDLWKGAAMDKKADK